MTVRLPPEIVVATTNAHKVVEIAAILAALGVRGVTALGLSVAAPGLVEPDEDALTFAGNARIKAQYYALHAGKACLSDDSGLCVDALGGAPGIYSSRYAASDQSRIARLLGELSGAHAMLPDQRRARFVCAVCLAFPEGRIVEAEGVCGGVVAQAPAGDGGFGYDPVFYLPHLCKTAAQLSPEEKNDISHRRRAMTALVSKLSGNQSAGTNSGGRHV